jgi:hypothetical protein
MRTVRALAGPALLALALPVFGGQFAESAATGLDQCGSHKVCFWSKPDFQGLTQFDDADPNSDCASMDNVESAWFRDGTPGEVLELWRGTDCAGTPDVSLPPGGKQDNFAVGSYKLEQK